MYTVYKIKVITTGHYYVGVTSNITMRRKKHLTSIGLLLRPIKFGIASTGGLSCYSEFAKQLIKGKRVHQVNNKLLEGLWFGSLLHTRNFEEAKDKENELLAKGVKSKLCLNIQKESHYNKRCLLIKK